MHVGSAEKILDELILLVWLTLGDDTWLGFLLRIGDHGKLEISKFFQNLNSKSITIMGNTPLTTPLPLYLANLAAFPSL